MYLTFILLAVEGEQQVPTLILSQVYIQRRKSTYYDYTIRNSWNWELGLVGPAPALLREGDWSHVQDTTPGIDNILALVFQD